MVSPDSRYILVETNRLSHNLSKITEEIPKLTPTNYEVRFHSSEGFFIKL